MNYPQIIHLSDFHLSVPMGLEKHWWRDLPLGTVGELLKSGVSLYLGVRHMMLFSHPIVVMALVKYIEENFPDTWVAVSGDLTDKGEEEEYQLARKLLEPIIKKGRLIVVPGNHDDALLPNIWTRGIGHFYKYFGDCLGDEKGEFPFVRRLGEDVFLIGLNSAHDIPRPSGTGSIGEKQRQNLAELLNSKDLSGKTKILLVHHDPFNINFFTELNDALELLEIIRSKVDVILCGHKHNSRVRRKINGIKLSCTASQSVLLDKQGNIHFRLIEIKSRSQISIKHHSVNLQKKFKGTNLKIIPASILSDLDYKLLK